MSRNGVLFALMCVVWGLTWLPLKVAAAEVPPIFLASARFLIASAFFFVWAGRDAFRAVRPAASRLLGAALLINTGCYAFLFWGVKHAPTGLSAIVNFALIPVFTILFGLAYGEEVLTRRRAYGMALGALGLVLLFWARVGEGREGVWTAIALGAVVAATLSYCWGAVLSRPLVRVMSPITLAAWQCLLGGLGLGVLSALVESAGLADVARLASWPVWPALAFLVLGGSLVGFAVYLKLLRDWGPFRAALYSFVSPIIAVAVGVLALDEPLGPAEAAGALLMLTATGLVMRRV